MGPTMEVENISIRAKGRDVWGQPWRERSSVSGPREGMYGANHGGREHQYQGHGKGCMGPTIEGEIISIRAKGRDV